jgi:anti-sigma factor RsiW
LPDENPLTAFNDAVLPHFDRQKLHLAYVDGALDSAGSLVVEPHMRGCASFLADGENLHGLVAAIENASLRFKVPARLNRNVRADRYRIRFPSSRARSQNFSKSLIQTEAA